MRRRPRWRTPALHLTSDEILVLFSRIHRRLLSHTARKLSSSPIVAGRFLRTRCVRPVRSKLPARAGAERRKSLDFRNCISMQVNDTAGMHKRYCNNSCLPGERETAPSLGVRLVNAGRKREEKPKQPNRTTETVGKVTMDKTTEGARRCRNSQPAKAG